MRAQIEAFPMMFHLKIVLAIVREPFYGLDNSQLLGPRISEPKFMKKVLVKFQLLLLPQT